MNHVHQFELIIGMILATLALHQVADRLKWPPAVALLAGGVALALIPGVPTISIDADLVLVLFLPPLLFDSAWSIPLGQLQRHRVGIAGLAVGAVVFSTAVVAAVTHFLMPALPWAACAALGAIVAPPDAVSARAVMQRVTLPRRLRILLEGESLLNDAAGMVLFRFAIVAGGGAAFSATAAMGQFVLLAVGGAAIGTALGFIWVKLARRAHDEFVVIAATVVLSWMSYIVAEQFHVSGVISAVAAGLVTSWHAHTVMTAATRMRGYGFWAVLVFMLEAVLFLLVGLSLRDVVTRAGGFGPALTAHVGPALVVLAVVILARFVWAFATDAANAVAHRLGRTVLPPLGARASVVIGWTGVRGVVTLALALSVPESFPGRDFFLVTAFIVIAGTVLSQATTLERVIAWARLIEPAADHPKLTMSQAESAMAQQQLAAVKRAAYDDDGELIHPQLLETYTKRATIIVNYAESPEQFQPRLRAHFSVVLQAIAAGRTELVRLHRAGEIDDATLHELERDLDIEELGARAAMA